MTALDVFPPMPCPVHGGDRWSCRACGERLIVEDRHGYLGPCRGYKISRFRAEQQFPCACGFGVTDGT